MTLRPFSADLQQTYRTTLGTPGAPETIDDGVPVTPVAIVAGNLTATASFSTVNATSVNASMSGGASGTLYTVPAGRRARIIAASLTCENSGAATNTIFRVLGNGVILLSLAHRANAAGQGQGAISQNWDYTAAIQLSAGQTITWANSGGIALASEVSVQYVEEAV